MRDQTPVPGTASTLPRGLSLGSYKAMESAAAEVFVAFNVCEGLLWTAIAIGLLVVLSRNGQNPDLMLPLALLFAVFGVSDWVEIGTGGWYKPWWMLAWKAANLLGLATILLLLRKRDSALLPSPTPSDWWKPAVRIADHSRGVVAGRCRSEIARIGGERYIAPARQQGAWDRTTAWS